ncbi:MAG: SUMF1/EgtB/PvdO family nonheme iron enzyme [Puniceicoccaceae bacterium]
MLAEFIQLPKEGETVGPYVLRQTLSTSILGCFYQATNKLKHENVLLHIVPEALMRADSRFQQSYMESIQRQKRMASSTAMAAQEVQRVSGNLVIQYPEGNYKSMNDVILKRSEPLPEERVRELLRGIAEGLTEAGKLNLGHYFMSPDFLFLNENGELRIAGIGLFQSIQYESFERFVSGAVIPISGDKKKSFSALEILSPEIRNFKARDLRSDFYCIGMCAYFMLTGSKPERRWATPTKARKEVSDGWDLFISHCLEAKPADRFPNYKAFLKDLDNIDDLTAEKRPETGQLFRKLSRVPLPQALESLLSMRLLIFVRLILLGVVGVLTIGSASMFYQIIFSDDVEEVRDIPIRRVATEDMANMIVNVSPRDALVTIRGPQSGRFTPRGFPLFLKGKSGHYSITVMAPRMRTIQRKIELIASDPMKININLRPDFANLLVKGAVGTEVYVLGEENFLLHLGSIESSDGLIINDRLLTGTYKLVGLHKSLMPALTEPLKLARQQVEVSLSQPPRPTELVVNTEPEGAMVFVDGSLVGVTPMSVERLDTGRLLKVRIEKEAYRAVFREVRFEPGQQIVLSPDPLELKIGTLRYRIDLSMPNAPELWELMLSINGETRRAEETESFTLREGGHQVILEHPDFFPLEKRVTVMDREETEVVLTLQPRPVRLNPTILDEVPVRFYVDGEETALAEAGYLPVPASREVRVEAVIRNYLTVIKQMSGKPNERMDWEVPLRRIPGPEKGEDWSPPYFDMPMAWLAPVEFTMGSPIDEFMRLPNEDRVTNVRLTKGIWMGKYEVTQDLYFRVMGDRPSEFTGENLPVDTVSWDEAMEFCRRLSEFEASAERIPEGYAYRLPTEAEWEYAARGGTETPFSFGGEASPEEGNFHSTYAGGELGGKSADERYGTLPIGSFEPNAFGLHDVHGNVAEWAIDRFWDRHPGGTVEDPVNLRTGRGYALRGGSWRDSADRVRSAAREGAPGRTKRNSIGFRVVLGPELAP